MLHPKHNRLDYGRLLMPPDGYTLTKAIGTTYSLDLDALMIMPVAMFYSESTDRPKNEIRVDMIDAIRKAADKITIYYQQGKLQVPKKYHYLIAFWEKGIHEVRMPHYAASFHPKVWISRFEAEGLPAKYRLIITSRNLTFANDYDIAFSTEGEVSKTLVKQNEPLISFLKYLNDVAPGADEQFISDLQSVHFSTPDKFTDLKFHPVGISNAIGKYTHPLFDYKWQEMLVISPFVDNTTVKQLSSVTEKPVLLLSKQEELSYLKSEIRERVQPWQFSKFIEQSTHNEEIAGNEEEPLPQSLHAKMYIALYDNQPYWYMGSANCTAPANERNIEFLVELTATGRGYKPKDVLSLLTEPDKNSVAIFEKFTLCDIQELEKQKNIDLQVRKILYELYQVEIDASVHKKEHSNLYDFRLQLYLESFQLPSGFSIAVRPITNIKEMEVALQPGSIQAIDSFTDYPESLLTPYFAVFIYYKEEQQAQSTCCIPIQLPSTRLNKIFSAIINSRERFMEYLYFLLNGEQTGVLEDGQPSEKVRGTGEAATLFDGKPVFENLLIAASRDPEKLKNIEEIIKKLRCEDEDKPDNEKIVSGEFLQFWDVFSRFLTKNQTYA